MGLSEHKRKLIMKIVGVIMIIGIILSFVLPLGLSVVSAG